MRINVGCGQTPTKGWMNFDNPFSIYLSKMPFLMILLYKLRLLEEPQYQFIKFCQLNHIEYGDATKRLPLEDGSIDAFYSSHMIEHLDQTDLGRVLKEARRVLCPGGIIRLVVPDLRKLAEQYIESRDADKFISSILLCQSAPRRIIQKLRVMITGNRNHRWMYDGESLRGILTSHGFLKASVMPPGKTRIKNHESLDLKEREAESVYVEAENP